MKAIELDITLDMLGARGRSNLFTSNPFEMGELASHSFHPLSDDVSPVIRVIVPSKNPPVSGRLFRSFRTF
jgi:hypothetical protein